MPYKTKKEAKAGRFPTTAEGMPLTLSQINKLAEIYDSVKEAGTAEVPMAVAWTTWKKVYKIKSGKWIKAKRERKPSAFNICVGREMKGTKSKGRGDKSFYKKFIESIIRCGGNVSEKTKKKWKIK